MPNASPVASYRALDRLRDGRAVEVRALRPDDHDAGGPERRLTRIRPRLDGCTILLRYSVTASNVEECA
jgi:hypothetical protein